MTSPAAIACPANSLLDATGAHGAIAEKCVSNAAPRVVRAERRVMRDAALNAGVRAIDEELASC